MSLLTEEISLFNFKVSAAVLYFCAISELLIKSTSNAGKMRSNFFIQFFFKGYLVAAQKNIGAQPSKCIQTITMPHKQFSSYS